MTSAIKAALVAPLLLVAISGAVRMGRRSVPLPPPCREIRNLVPSEFPCATSFMTSSTRAPEMPSETVRLRKPYPLRHLSEGHPAAAVRTWSILESKRVTMEVENETLPNRLEFISSLTGLSVVAADGLEDDPVSFKVEDLVADHALRLMLRPRKMDYEILPDGTIRVDAEDRIQGGYEKVGQRAMDRLQELDRVRRELNCGWDGLARMDPGAHVEEIFRTMRLVTVPGETSLAEEIHRLSELGIMVHLVHNDELNVAEIMSMRFIQAAADRSLEDHLQGLARMQGMVALPYYGSVILAKEEHAAPYREEAEKPRQDHRRLLDLLQTPVEVIGKFDVPDFLDSVGRSHGLDVLSTESAWNCPATLSIPAGTTLRQALDQLKRHGLRWAMREGKLYILR